MSYRDIMEANVETTENWILPNGIGAPDPNSPGQLMLQRAIQNQVGIATDVADLYQAFLTTPLRVNWEWRPSGPGYSANRHGVLDGTKDFGECKHFALALLGLARCPAPWGLGLPHSQVQLDTYKGANNNQGFVSNHPRIFLRLPKNVQRPPGNLDDLYLWEDHKTVLWNNVLYDVCYETTYVAQAGMAVYTLTGVNRQTSDGGFAERATRIADGAVFWFQRSATWVGPISDAAFQRSQSTCNIL